jgi:hypothetical protein
MLLAGGEDILTAYLDEMLHSGLGVTAAFGVRMGEKCGRGGSFMDITDMRRQLGGHKGKGLTQPATDEVGSFCRTTKVRHLQQCQNLFENCHFPFQWTKPN